MSASVFKYPTVKLLKIILIIWSMRDISWTMQNTLCHAHFFTLKQNFIRVLKNSPIYQYQSMQKNYFKLLLYLVRIHHGSIYNWGDNPEWLQLHTSVICLQVFVHGVSQQKLQAEPNNVVMADIPMPVRNLHYVVVKIVLRLLFGSFYSNIY